jgi:DNA-binding transcriptional LysR family regulator
MLPDIDSLALFVRAAELRSLTKAAEASHIGLAAASRRIALLEHRFKTTLFDRSPKGVELTAAGNALLAHGKTLLMQMNQMQAEMSDHAAGRRGALRILANTSAMTEFVPGDLASYSRLHPDITLVVEERWSSEIVQAVLSYQADVGIIVEGVPSDGLDVFPYRSDRLAAVMPAGHELSCREELCFTDVLDHDIIALESGSSMMRLLAEHAVIAEKSLRLRVQVRSFEVVCRMVQAGLGVGLLPYQAATALSTGMALSVRRLSEDWAERRMLVCVQKDRSANGLVTSLLDHLISSTVVAAPTPDLTTCAVG